MKKDISIIILFILLVCTSLFFLQYRKKTILKDNDSTLKIQSYNSTINANKDSIFNYKLELDSLRSYNEKVVRNSLKIEKNIQTLKIAYNKNKTIGKCDTIIVFQDSLISKKDTIILNQENELSKKNAIISLLEINSSKKDTVITIQNNELVNYKKNIDILNKEKNSFINKNKTFIGFIGGVAFSSFVVYMFNR